MSAAPIPGVATVDGSQPATGTAHRHLRRARAWALIASLLSGSGALHADNLTPLQFVIFDEPVDVEAPGTVRVSGTLRERATYLSSVEFDPEHEHDGWFWTQRLSVTGDVRANPWLAGRVTLLSALQEGGEDSPIERNELDLQEAYLDFGNAEAMQLRVGRQELVLGSQRLLGSRNGTNVKRTWDGLRATVHRGAWRLDALALREVQVDTDGAFNDDSDDGAELAGVYGSGTVPFLPGRLDAYYLYTESDDRLTIEGTADQERHTVGVRSFGEVGSWFWNWEAIYQFGDHGDLDIAAWSLASNTGYRFPEARWHPELMLSVNIGSGDDNNGDGELGTFDALFARGSYFSELALLAPSNFVNVHPYLKVHPSETLTAFVDVNFYWRLEEEDGLYANPTRILREPGASEEHFANVSVSAGLEWEASDAVFLSVLYTHAAPQRFVEETGAAHRIDFLELTARFRF